VLHFSIYSLGTRVSSTNKTDRHDITDILLKVLLNTITPSMYLFPWIMLIKLRLSKIYVFLFRVRPKLMYFFSEYVQNLCISFQSMSKIYVFLFRVCPKSMYFFSEYVKNICISFQSMSKIYVFLFRVCQKYMYFFSEYVKNLCTLCTSFLIYFKYNALNYANNRHDITEILLKVALNTINLTLNYANYTKVVQVKVLTLDYACYTVRKVQFYPCEWLPIY
jgi:hypothetical protein